MSYISFEDVCKDYPAGNTVVHASDHVNFHIEKGEFCVVLGPSGAGKTTVLNLLGGMDKATSGRIIVGDKEITGLRSSQLTEYRRHDVGFVFQFYNLMPNLTALENVELAQQVCERALDPREVLEQVGLGRTSAGSADPPVPRLQHNGRHHHAQRQHCAAGQPPDSDAQRQRAGNDRK